MLRAIIPSAAALVCALVAPAASAYCRTTTCKPEEQSCARNADECVREGAPATWPGGRIPYRFTADAPPDLRTVFRAAAARWSNVECGRQRTSLRFVEMDPSLDPESSFTVVFRDKLAGRPKDELGLTTLDYGNRTGTVGSARMELDMGLIRAGVGFDLDVVLTHELGHYLGLAHNREPSSIMQERYESIVARGAAPNAEASMLVDGGIETGGTKPDGADDDLEPLANDLDRARARALGPDDMLAVCTLYPPLPLDQLPRACSAADGIRGHREPPLVPIAALSALGGVALLRRRTACSSRVEKNAFASQVLPNARRLEKVRV